MPDALVTLERRPDGVALVRLDRPKMNAISAELLGQLRAVVGEMEDQLPAAVVVWGGPRIFAAGADVTELGDPERARVMGTAFHRALDALAALPRATFAAVNGYALGGGCELALACDLRVAGQGAHLGQPEVLLGIIPGGGGTQRLPRLIGPAKAKDLVLSGRQVAAEEALAMGLVDRIVPDDAVLDAALSWAAELARGAVVAQGLAKRAIDEGLSRPLAQGLTLERALFLDSFRTEDAVIGVRSFLESGPGNADFVGR
ncbi:MAG: enoyl-CoA hydratase/isomerase family protein [Acidimicrobiales bacterium]